MSDTANGAASDTAERDEAQVVETLHMTIDGTVVDARPGELIIEAAERAGVYIPRFCYHPRMEPVGMCRMCLVEVSGPRGFSLQPACFIRVADGQEIVTGSPKARKAQEGVLEFLLLNHPLDCPVCDKGGECPLQDQALSHGPGESRFVEEKRHWEKPISIGPLVYLDRERCIQCARCTRFADEVAGDASIDFAFRGSAIEVAPFPDRPFDSYFSGNTVQICPVGALTATPYRFKSRPWDLEQVETTCTSCSVGCRVVAQSSAGELVRYLGVDSDPVNRSWLCDKGRYGFQAISAETRLTEPLVRDGESLQPARWHDALREVAAGVRQALATGAPGSIAVIGGARLTNEDAYAWSKLARTVFGTDSVDAQLGDGLPAPLVLGLPRATIDEVSSARVVVLLCADAREELPILYLRLREAARRGTAIVECSPTPTALSSLARVRCRYRPGEIAQLVSALLGRGSGDAGGVDPSAVGAARSLLSGDTDGAEQKGDGVVILAGRSSLAESGLGATAAAALLHDAFPAARFLPTLRRANVHGALDMGLAPGVLPGRVSLDAARSWFADAWGSRLPEETGLDAAGILGAAAEGTLKMLVLLGADPLADFPDRDLAERAIRTVPFLVAVATHQDASSSAAHVVLPVAGDGERTGTTTNLEGRVSRLAPKVVAPGVAWPAWTVASEVARRLGGDLGFENVEAISAEIERLAPAYRGVTLEVLGRPGGRDGIVVPVAATPVAISGRGARRPIDPMATPGITSVEEQGAPLRVGAAVPLGGEAEPQAETDVDRGASGEGRPKLLAGPGVVDVPTPAWRDAYSHRLVLRRSLYDGGTLVGASPSLASLARPSSVALHPDDLARLGIEPGGEVRVRSARGAVLVRAEVDDALERGLVVMTTNAASSSSPEGGEVSGPASRLVDAAALVTDVRLETP